MGKSKSTKNDSKIKGGNNEDLKASGSKEKKGGTAVKVI